MQINEIQGKTNGLELSDFRIAKGIAFCNLLLQIIIVVSSEITRHYKRHPHTPRVAGGASIYMYVFRDLRIGWPPNNRIPIGNRPGGDFPVSIQNFRKTLGSGAT